MLEIGQQLAKLWKEADEETKVHLGCSGVLSVLKRYSAFSGVLCSLQRVLNPIHLSMGVRGRERALLGGLMTAD